MSVPRWVRLFLGIYSPSRLALGDTYEIAIVWKSRRLAALRWLRPLTYMWGV